MGEGTGLVTRSTTVLWCAIAIELSYKVPKVWQGGQVLESAACAVENVEVLAFHERDLHIRERQTHIISLPACEMPPSLSLYLFGIT